jgi:hypothetical protein
MGKPLVLFAGYLLAATCMVPSTGTAAPAGVEQVAQVAKPFRVSALCFEGGSFEFFFENNTDFTIDYINFDVTYHDKKYPNNQIDIGDVHFDYVDAQSVGQQSVNISGKHCSKANMIRIRAVKLCVVGGKSYSDCKQFLGPDVIEIDGVTP